MGVFEFVNILWSILFSLAFAHMLAGLASLIRAGRGVRWSPLHGLWWGSVLLCVVANWISLWDLHELPEWTTAYILLLLVALFAQYLTCYLISPEVSLEARIDLVAFHEEHHGRYLCAFGLLNSISIPLNLITASSFGVDAWGWQNLAQGPAAALTLAAAFAGRRWMEWPLAVAVFALSVLYLLGLQNTIR